jgi:hypothetical protein
LPFFSATMLMVRYFPLGSKSAGLVGDEVAAANQVAKFIERFSQRHHVAWKQSFSATALTASPECWSLLLRKGASGADAAAGAFLNP